MPPAPPSMPICARTRRHAHACPYAHVPSRPTPARPAWHPRPARLASPPGPQVGMRGKRSTGPETQPSTVAISGCRLLPLLAGGPYWISRCPHALRPHCAPWRRTSAVHQAVHPCTTHAPPIWAVMHPCTTHAPCTGDTCRAAGLTCPAGGGGLRRRAGAAQTPPCPAPRRLQPWHHVMPSAERCRARHAVVKGEEASPARGSHNGCRSCRTRLNYVLVRCGPDIADR